jgi:hypothetical protein
VSLHAFCSRGPVVRTPNVTPAVPQAEPPQSPRLLKPVSPGAPPFRQLSDSWAHHWPDGSTGQTSSNTPTKEAGLTSLPTLASLPVRPVRPTSLGNDGRPRFGSDCSLPGGNRLLPMEEVEPLRRASGERDARFGGSDMDPHPPMTSGIICRNFLG